MRVQMPALGGAANVGSRYDRFFYEVRNRLDPANSPAVNSGVWSPKAGIAITPCRDVELYANYGEGFRSPSVVDDLLSNPALRPMKLVSREVGLHIAAVPRTSLAVDAWTTDIANESFQAAPGLPEQNIGRSRRSGYDIEGRYRAWSGAAGTASLFANLGTVSAHLIAQGPSAIYVPNVPAYVAQIGADFDVGSDAGRHLGGQVRVDLVGHQNLSEDGGQRTKPYPRIAGKLNYDLAEGWTAFSQATWYPGDRLSEFAVNFGPLTGATSSDIFVSPVPAFTFLIGLTYRFKTGA